MSTAIIGAGWAGLAAAARLMQAGEVPHVFEAAAQPGGRARTIHPAALGLAMDNGQHVLLGACRRTLGLMAGLGIRPPDVLDVHPLKLATLDGRFSFSLPSWRRPWNLVGSLLLSRGLGGPASWWHLQRVLQAARTPGPAMASTAADWLTSLGCPPRLLESLWRPLALAALNTPLEQACASLLARLLNESLGAADAQASQLLIPRTRLHELWPAVVCTQLGGRLVHGRIHSLEHDGSGWRVDGQPFRQVIVATPASEARRLLSPLDQASAELAGWPHAQQGAIATLTLQLEEPWPLPYPMMMLRPDDRLSINGHWLFSRCHTARSPAQRCLLHVVIARAHGIEHLGRHAAAEQIVRQIDAQSVRPLPAVRAHLLVNEKRATFDALPGLRRPGPGTRWHGLFLAGDWTDTGYPATLEGAVCSGLQAAERALAGQTA